MPTVAQWVNGLSWRTDLYIGLVELSVPPEVQSGPVAGSISADSRDSPPQLSQFTLLIDVVRLIDLAPALEYLEFYRIENFERRRFQFDTSLIAANRDEVRSFFQGFDPDDGRQWRLFQVSRTPDKGVEVLLYEDLALGAASHVWLTMTEQVPSGIQALLEQFSSLEDLSDATSDELQNIVQAINSGPGGSVAIYDVGQGNCNSLSDSSGSPVLYFDFGHPLSINAHTAPVPPPVFALSAAVPIILSHWDYDHWGAAKRPKPQRWLAAAIQATWIAPRQYLGPMHLSLAAAIVRNGQLLVWGNSGPSHIGFANGEVLRCTGPNTMRRQERNDSGLALYATDSGAAYQVMRDPILLPADAEFCFIPLPQSFSMTALLGLVASHHGGAIAHPPSVALNQQSILAVSVGAGNSYRHPSPSAYQVYQSAGWAVIKETRVRPTPCQISNAYVGGIGLNLTGGTATPACCQLAPCTLCIVQ